MPSVITDDGAFVRDSIAVVTVNWNGWRNTLACLSALRRERTAGWRLYIVDNASEDDSLARLANLGSDVTLIKSPLNGGWTGGNNLGVKQALDDKHEFIFLINNDAFVAPNSLSILRDCFRANEGRMPILGPVHRDVDGTSYGFLGTSNDKITGFPAWNHTDGIEPASLQETFETSTISGAGIFAHRLHFEKIGLFDERFFLYFDEFDWCFRAKSAGFPLLMVRDAVIDHIGSASVGQNSPLQEYFITRNALLFAEKHLTLRQRLCLLRRHIWRTRHLPRETSPNRSMLRFLTEPTGQTAAFRHGLLDYFRRRFGDCPGIFRR